MVKNGLRNFLKPKVTSANCFFLSDQQSKTENYDLFLFISFSKYVFFFRPDYFSSTTKKQRIVSFEKLQPGNCLHKNSLNDYQNSRFMSDD